MSDYNGLVYRKQGGNEMVVAAGGTLTLQGQVYGSNAGVDYYVNSVDGSSGNDGLSWATAKATLAQAMALATASNGDVIHLSPFHAQTITGAAGEVISKIGVTVVGHGLGRQRPTFTFTTAVGASFDITAAKCALVNCVFVNGINAQTAMLNVSAADVTIRDCEFMTGDGSTAAVLGVLTTSAADRLRIEGNHFHGLVAATGTTSQISLVGGDSIVIRDNVIVGACGTTGNILSATTAPTNTFIIGNFLLNMVADGNNKVIVLHASNTGLIANNRIGIIDSTSPAPVTAAGAYVAGNYFTGAAGVSASTLM